MAALRAAGATVLGKTQTHEFAWGITSVNEALGSARNPWDPARIAGGSSGGSAVAVAARMVPLALGIDTGGSIRIPAAFCGVLGFKPTFPRLDVGGAFPLAPSLDHVGVIARDPADITLATGIEPAAGGLGTVVLGPGLPAGVAEVFEGLGAQVVERPLPDADRLTEVFRVVQAREALAVHRDAGLYPARADEYGRDVRRRLDAAAEIDDAEHESALRERDALRAEIDLSLRTAPCS